MAVGSQVPFEPIPVPGVRLATTCAGIKYDDRDDLTLFEIESEHAQCAAVFTQNAFCAAPVVIAKQHLEKGVPRYLLINSGNANAGLGNAGLRDALQCCDVLAMCTGSDPSKVLPFSTGVIGEPLPADKIVSAIPKLVENLAEDQWSQAAKAIMTTDTRLKGISKTAQLDDTLIVITGVAKGAGMIQPNMATMLSFVATDVRITQPLLQACIETATDLSFNSITVDGDTSTNDAAVLMATGRADMDVIEHADDPRFAAFQNELIEVFQKLAEAIILDAEGATRLARIEVREGLDREEARLVAFCVANSPLFKTALFAGDPNWGRILAAIGRAGISNLDVSGVDIYLGPTQIVAHGMRAESYTEQLGIDQMTKDRVVVAIDLGRGNASASVLTSDLSYDYVKINAEYRT